MATQKGTGLVERAVREALGTLVSPQLCDQIIARSLAAHGLSSIPEHGPELRTWLEEGLRSDIEVTVGADAADLVVQQLAPIAAYAAIAVPRTRETSQVQPQPQKPRVSSVPSRAAHAPSDPFADNDGLPVPSFDSDNPDRPTALRFDVSQEPNWETQPMPVRTAFDSGPPTGMYAGKEVSYSPLPDNENAHASNVRTLPPVRGVSDRPTHEALYHTTRPQESLHDKEMPVVLTATADAHDLEALRRYLARSADVVHVRDLVGLLDALDGRGIKEPIVLIDCQRPTVHVTSVAAIGEDLPKGTTVVLWGADDPTWAQIDKERAPNTRWVRCSREATTDDVGSLCSMLLG